jgi:hypothetical protein
VLEGDEAARAGEIALSENVNRLAMHPLDEGALFKTLLENGEPVQNIVKRYDRKASEIYQRIRLLSLFPAVRELFRDGGISLVAAAMLADLDDGQQARFVEETARERYRERYYDNTIPDYVVRNYIAALYHDRLYGFIADKACAGCKKRTFYTDKGLFPEIEDASDSCLDHPCYLGKWQKTLEKILKAAVQESPELADSRILIITDKNIRNILGNKIMLGKGEFLVKPREWNLLADGPGKDTQAVFDISLGPGERIAAALSYRREKPKPERKPADSGFKPALQLLDLPKAEEKAVVETLRGKNVAPYEFGEKVRDRVFWRLMEAKAALPDDAYGQKDAELFISELVFNARYGGSLVKDEKKIFKLFTGYDCDGDAGKLLRQASWEKICALVTAMNLRGYVFVPDAEDFAKGKKKLLGWFPYSEEEIREIYREEIRALLPKPKPEAGKRAGSGGKKKEAAQ